MRHLLRPSPLFLLLSYLAVSALPFAPLLLSKPVSRPWQVLGVECIAWVAAWAIFKRPAFFHWLLLPAFLALPTELYLVIYYGQGISTHHLGIIAETSPKEAMEFLGRRAWVLLALMAAMLLWWAGTLRAARRTALLDWNDASRRVALAALAGGVAVWGYGERFGIAAPPASASASVSSAPAAASALSPFAGAGRSAPPLPRWAVLPLELDAFAHSWPFGLMARGVDFYQERRYLAELGRGSSNFRFGARQLVPDDQPEVVVMVIGESSRYDRWSLNGYARETNPQLKAETNLVVLPDIITPVSATRLSVPVMISRKAATQSLKDGFSEKSFLSAYKEAGFKTWWLSNQTSFGKFDTPVSVFAGEADVLAFLNLGGFTDHSNFDQILFDPVRQALADPARKKLIVLHSLGSHWNYSQRYPKQFDRWQPSLFGVDKPVYTDTAIKPQLNNSYDNSILYTDWFLAQLIGILKHAEQRSALLYVADHGQTLYDGSCKLAFHGHNTAYEFHVPGLLWYSDQYRTRYPDKVAQLARHRQARLSTENMFHTLLDLSDIRYDGERLAWSFVSSQFTPHKRLVDSYGWTNYDNATLKGDCREVIDKGKPLRQDK